MIKKKRLPQSVRKFIRREKARFRRSGLDLIAQQKLIKELYLRYKNYLSC